MKPGHPLTQAAADAARTAPFWPFAPLSPQQSRQRTAFETAMQHGRLACARGLAPDAQRSHGAIFVHLGHAEVHHHGVEAVGAAEPGAHLQVFA